jgi:hypothetical protein
MYDKFTQNRKGRAMSDKATKVLDWEPPMPPTDLIFDDGEPLETNRHRIAMNTLIRSLQQAWGDLQERR